MSSLGNSKGILEVGKFAVYVSVPIVMMYVFANNSENLRRVMRNRSYVVYPPAGPPPPTQEEINDMVEEYTRKNNLRGR